MNVLLNEGKKTHTHTSLKITSCGAKNQIENSNKNQTRERKKAEHFEVSEEKRRKKKPKRKCFCWRKLNSNRKKIRRTEKHSHIAKHQVCKSEKLVRFAIDRSTHVLVVTSFCLSSSFAASFASLIHRRHGTLVSTQFNPLYAIYCSFWMVFFFFTLMQTHYI